MLRLAAHRSLIAATILAGGFVGRPALAAWPHDPTVNLRVAPTSAHQTPGGIVPDGAGGVIIVWSDSRGADQDIYAQHITADGTVSPGWPSSGLAVCTAGGNQHEPSAASDGAGGAILAWTDQRGGASPDIYAMRVNGDGTFPGAWPANGRQLLADSHSESGPVIVGDGAGGADVAWTYVFGLGDADLYGARVDGSGTVLWAHSLYAPVANQYNPTLVADGAGGLILGFQDNQSGNFDVRAARFAGTGAFVWGPVNASAASGDQIEPVSATDGAGGIILAWRDERLGAGDPNVYAQRITSAGATVPGWTFDGSAVCLAAGIEAEPRVVSDGAAGAIIAWTDYRTYPSDIYAQRILPGGTTAFGWPVDGAAICTDAAAQFLETLVSDGAGGAIIVWQDYRRDPDCDLYMSRVTPSGGVPPGWIYGGAPLALGGSTQQMSVMAPNGSGGAIVAWGDWRDGNFQQVYAQNVDRFAQLGDARPGIVSVKDVKADQGGHVRMVWNASWLDANPTYAISSYWIWRQTPAGVAVAAVKTGAAWADGSGEEAQLAVTGDGGAPLTRLFRHADDATAGFAWEYVASQPANGSPQYSYIAPTASDSVAGYNPYTVFMVEARGTVVGAFWDSPADSGYSVDNLPPLTPAPFAGNYSAGATHLHWGPNLEADLANYRLYRGSSAGFVPGPSNLIGTPPDTGFADAGDPGYYYKLSAVDAHGNESGFALLSPSGTTDVTDGPALVLALARPAPNPARGAARINFALPRETRVSLAIYDVAGRRERMLVDGVLPAGEHAQTWDLRDQTGSAAHAGLYFVRMEAEGRHFTQRLVVAE